MSWWRKHWRWLLASGVAALGMIVLIILYVIRKQKQLDALKAELALMQAAAKVAGLKADRAARAVELKQNDAARKVLDQDIAIARREAVAIVKDVEGMSDVDVSIEFRDMGY